MQSDQKKERKETAFLCSSLLIFTFASPVTIFFVFFLYAVPHAFCEASDLFVCTRPAASFHAIWFALTLNCRTSRQSTPTFCFPKYLRLACSISMYIGCITHTHTHRHASYPVLVHPFASPGPLISAPTGAKVLQVSSPRCTTQYKLSKYSIWITPSCSYISSN